MTAKGTFPFKIKSRWSDATIFTAKLDAKYRRRPVTVQLGEAVKQAVLSHVNLSGASLSGASLSNAALSGANLSGANLSDVNLWGANLSHTNLSGASLLGASLSGVSFLGANLSGAGLLGANLSGVNLWGANLSHTNLSNTNLSGANLSHTNLSYVNFSGADLSEAVLTGAALSGATLFGAKNAELAMAMTVIVPEGDLIGWKRCQDDVIVKLFVPAGARRSNAYGRKCRAEYADVLEVIGAKSGISEFDGRTEYRVGHRVNCGQWDDNRWNESAGGIHFFLTRIEAENF